MNAAAKDGTLAPVTRALEAKAGNKVEYDAANQVTSPTRRVGPGWPSAVTDVDCWCPSDSMLEKA
jgi:hypothetical protein